ncbi:MAG: hypothetical protein LiPW16_98 [Microgenomates group bacterium LiPW_16]|nr:MAG: hypothetical protein LiPW16_98 [Microgenomates group bacterium LiPW_16]
MEKNIWRLASLAFELGFIIAIPPVLGIYLGFWLDKNFGTKPVLTVFFLIGGLVLAILATRRIIKKTLSS